MKKINVILIVILFALLGGVGFLGFTLFKEMNTVKVPDLNKATLTEVNEWCGSLKENPCKIDFEYSDTVDKDIVIYQSIKEGEKVDGTINFTVSLGKKPVIEIPSNLLNMKKAEIESWANINGLTAVTYVVESSDDVIEGNVIRIVPQSSPFYQDTPVEVVVSCGPAVPEKNIVDGKIEITSGEFAGITVSSFESKVKKLKLVPYHNTDKDAYNSSIAKGNIVWHGSGEYEENETISYGVCLGKKDTTDTIDISMGSYVGKTVTDFETAVKNLGLVPSKTDEHEDYSESIGKGKVIWHGSGEYENGEKIRYSVSLGKEGESDDIYVSKNTYVGKTVTEFEAVAKSLGLKPTKTDEHESYSDTVTKGNIIWHGSGSYVQNEEFRYSVSLGKKGESDEIIINYGDYIGKTVTEFESIAKSLGLKPLKIDKYEDYSDIVAKGNIIWHGSGSYVLNEEFKYCVSLGKKESVPVIPSTPTTPSNPVEEKIPVNLGDFIGNTVSEFETNVKKLGLVPTKASDKDAYSKTIPAGNVVWHGAGNYVKGEEIRYSVSKGPEPENTIELPNIKDIKGTNEGITFADTKSNVQSYLDRAGFTNYLINGEKSDNSSAGVIVSFTVNGSNHAARTAYKPDSKIVVTISTGLN